MAKYTIFNILNRIFKGIVYYWRVEIGALRKLAEWERNQFSYAGYEDVLHAKDQQNEVDFTYTALGSLLSRTQGGRKTVYAYNSQEEFISVANEIGETYRFERGAKGNIVKEKGYHGLFRTYERDDSGLVTEINRPRSRFTRYCSISWDGESGPIIMRKP